MFSPALFIRIMMSHSLYIISYSIAPLFLFYFLKTIRENKNRYLIISALLLAFSTIQIQFLPMLIFLLFIVIVIEKNAFSIQLNMKLMLKKVAIMLVFASLLLSYWITLSLSNVLFGKGSAFSSLVSIDQFIKTSPKSLWESLTTTGYPFAFFKDLATPLSTISLAILLSIPWIIFSLKTSNVEKKVLASFLFIALMYVLIVYGLYAPQTSLGKEVIAKLIRMPIINIILSLFREVAHLYFINWFIFACLMSISISLLGSRLLSISILFLVLTYIFSSPYFTFSLPTKDFNKYNEVFEWLRQNDGNGDFNILYIPMTSIVRYYGVNYPSDIWGRNPLLIFSEWPSPDLHSMEGSYGQRIAVHIYNILSQSDVDAEFLCKILAIWNFKYIIIQKDADGILDVNKSKLENILEGSSCWRKIFETNNITVFLNLAWKPQKIVVSDSVDCVFVNNLSKYIELFLKDNRPFLYFSCPASIENKRIVLEKKNYPELLAELYKNKDEVIDIPLSGSYSYDAINYWIDYYKTWYIDKRLSENLQNKIVTLGNNTLLLQFFVDESKEYTIFIKYFLRPLKYPIDPIDVEISVDNKTVTFLNNSNILVDDINWIKFNYNLTKGMHTIGIRKNDTHLYMLAVFRILIIPSNYLPYIQTFYRYVDANLTFTIDYEDPGSISYMQGGFVYELTINKSRNNNDIGISSKHFEEPLNWSNFTRLYFKVKVITNENFQIQFVIHDRIYGDMYQWLRSVTPLNVTQLQYIIFPNNLTSIDNIFFRIGEGWQEFGDGQKVILEASDFVLSDEDKIMILNNGEEATTKNFVEVLNITKVNPTYYVIRVEASKPFILSLAESYSPDWKAKIYKNGMLVEEVEPIPVYGIFNGFWINEVGNLTVVIRYVPQDLYELGLKVSGSTFALVIFYLVWDWRRGRGDKWAVMIERVFKKYYLSKVVSHLRR